MVPDCISTAVYALSKNYVSERLSSPCQSSVLRAMKGRQFTSTEVGEGGYGIDELVCLLALAIILLAVQYYKWLALDLTSGARFSQKNVIGTLRSIAISYSLEMLRRVAPRP